MKTNNQTTMKTFLIKGEFGIYSDKLSDSCRYNVLNSAPVELLVQTPNSVTDGEDMLEFVSAYAVHLIEQNNLEDEVMRPVMPADTVGCANLQQSAISPLLLQRMIWGTLTYGDAAKILRINIRENSLAELPYSVIKCPFDTDVRHLASRAAIVALILLDTLEPIHVGDDYTFSKFDMKRCQSHSDIEYEFSDYILQLVQEAASDENVQ